MTQSHEDDVEIEFAACRCRLPEEAAARVRERLRSASLRVTEDDGVGGRTILVAKHVVTIPTRPPGNRQFAARRVGNTVELQLLGDGVGDLTGETRRNSRRRSQ
jgi:hypothetical protein